MARRERLRRIKNGAHASPAAPPGYPELGLMGKNGVAASCDFTVVRQALGHWPIFFAI